MIQGISSNHFPPSKKSEKPARIPPQTPPPRGQNAKTKLVSVLRNPNPQKIVFAKPSPLLAPRRKKLPPSEFRQFLPSRRNPSLATPCPYRKKKIRIARKQKKHGQGVGEGGRDTAEAEGQPLRAVVERMLGRGGMEIAHRTLF